MKLCGLIISLQKQRLYLPFEFYTSSLNLTFSLKLTRTSAITTQDPQIGHANSTPNSISYSKLLSECRKTKSLSPGLQIHAHLTKIGFCNDPKIQNHLINLFSKCGLFGYARKLVDEILEPDLVAWSALIYGYAQNGLAEEALSAFHEMHLLGIKCNEFTFPSVLKACSIKKDLIRGKQIHGIVVVSGFESDVFVANTLVVMYAKCSGLLESRKDKFSLLTILHACTGLVDIGQGKKIHGYLMKLGYDSDPFSSNAVLVDMYAKLGDLRDANTIVEHIPLPDIVSWNAIIAGCILHEYHDRALELLGQVKRSGIRSNMFTLSSALKAFIALGL
ncbi:hypothetical protein LguiA_017150 [Lonicera macranthoides]